VSFIPQVVNSVPRLFAEAVAELHAFAWAPAIIVEEIDAPRHLGPFSAAIAADLCLHGDDVGSAKLILLHDPAGRVEWGGTFRCVTYASAKIGPELVHDPFLPSVAWSWLVDGLDHQQAEYAAPSGTVTLIDSTPFGSIESSGSTSELEIRASWTPILDDADSFDAHLKAWQELVCLVAGVPPLVDGVVPLTRRLEPRP